MNLKEKMKAEENLLKEHNLKIKGAIVVVLAEILMDRQIDILEDIANAIDEGESEEVIEELKSKSDVNEIVGSIVLKMMHESMGEKFMNGFCDREFDISAFTSNNTMYN